WPNDNKRINAQATTGIFLDAEATNLANTPKTLLVPVVFDPIRLKRKATAVPVVVAAIDMRIVSSNFSKIVGRRSNDSWLINKFENIHVPAFGKVARPWKMLNPVMAEELSVIPIINSTKKRVCHFRLAFIFFSFTVIAP